MSGSQNLTSRTSTGTTRFVQGVYAKLAPVYDVVFGRVLQPGRVAAVARMGRLPEAKILEVGVGTGLNATLYPSQYEVTGIDISQRMLAKAHERIRRERFKRIRLVQMDAARLAFPDGSFDFVYAPYTMSVVPDPVQAARERWRGCRVGGTILLLNHVPSTHPLISAIARFATPAPAHPGLQAHL